MNARKRTGRDLGRLCLDQPAPPVAAIDGASYCLETRRALRVVVKHDMLVTVFMAEKKRRHIDIVLFLLNRMI